MKTLVTIGLFACIGLTSVGIHANEPVDPEISGWWAKGRISDYQGMWPLHIAALSTRDFTHPDNPIAWSTVDTDTDTFELYIPPERGDSIYLLAQLDRERTGPTLTSSQLFFLRKTSFDKAEFDEQRLLFDLGDMELAHLIREGNPYRAPIFALALAILLYGMGFFWNRKLQNMAPTSQPTIPAGGWLLWLIAVGTTIPLLPRLGAESFELLEFTYLHEGLRPASVWALLTDPISAELSHPPVWPLILRAMSAISQAEWWLRLPSVLFHLGTVFVVYRLGAHRSGRPQGLLAAVLVGLAPIPFYYGQDASPYALVALLSASCTLCALREHWKTFAALMVVGFFTHYTMAVLGVAIAIGLLWQWRSDRNSGRLRRALKAYGLVCILPLFWSVHFIQTFFASGMSTRLMSSDYLPDPGFASYVSRFVAVVLGLPPEAAFVSLVALALVVWGAIKLRANQPLLARLVVVQMTLLIGYVVFVYVMYMRFADGRVFYAYRWTSAFLPIIALASAAGLIALWRIRRWIGIAATVLVVGAASIQDGRLLLQPQRPAQQEAVALIQSQAQPGDAFCALPAVYYAQLINFHLWDGQPEDWMAWPRTTGNLYGPFHQRNTTIESLSQNLAFRRIWVVDYHEQMFGTRKFDAASSEHQLAWLKKHLNHDPGVDHFPLDHMDVYLFHVPHEPKDPDLRAWKDDELVLDFKKQIHLFRYFPKLLHTQSTGAIMSQKTVAVRVPPPPFHSPELTVQLTVSARKTIGANDLEIPGIALTFQASESGGIWSGTLPSSTDRIDLSINRSEHLASVHMNTVLRLTSTSSLEQADDVERK